MTSVIPTPHQYLVGIPAFLTRLRTPVEEDETDIFLSIALSRVSGFRENGAEREWC
ncbi:hypothetical protein F2Q70_00016439 [Brassica cretica]|uniref:Uncharacterized protein n=1 Tax=Brassica cretica TaxID=69181 RepID=A0A8S9HWH7_BRACR|nr:hypothetical protein F2Q70_00016439 [Brassica cretica]